MSIPNHLGIIMDGNRRWAKNKGLPGIAGHKVGSDNAQKIVEHASNIGVKYITLWALSKDNLIKREEEELKQIIKLIDNIESYLNRMKINSLKFETIGDISKLPEKSQNILNKVKEQTKTNTGIVLILALVYSGRDEIIRGFQKAEFNGIKPSELDQDSIKKYLDSGIFPDVDLIIRTGGDTRHSGFLLYGSEYSEYYYTNLMWPEFNNNELEKAIESFNIRNRTFGGN